MQVSLLRLHGSFLVVRITLSQSKRCVTLLVNSEPAMAEDLSFSEVLIWTVEATGKHAHSKMPVWLCIFNDY